MFDTIPAVLAVAAGFVMFVIFLMLLALFLFDLLNDNDGGGYGGR